MKKREEGQTNPTDKAEKKFDFSPAGFFVMRTPLLPFGEFLRWSRGLQSASSPDDPEALSESLIADRALLRERLREMVAKPEIRDAIFVASPDLDDYLNRWFDEPESKRGARVEGALTRYFSRMCGRSTPFGLFAATSLGRIGERTRLTVEDQSRLKRHTRLDMDYLFALTDKLGSDPEIRRALTYRPNNSLYAAADRVRYVESRVNGRSRSYHLVAVERSDAIEATLRRAECGATIAELASALADDEITFDEAEQFIQQLIDHQILIADLALPVTGDEAIHPLIAQLQKLPAGQDAATILEQTRDELANLDAAGLGAAPETYRAVAERLESLPAKVELPRLFQVDMVRPAYEASLGEAPIREIIIGVETLRRIFARPVDNELSRFRAAFTARYEDREVPLVEALDDDLGIGYPAGAGVDGAEPLLRGLVFPARSEWATAWQARDAFLLRKLSEALTEGATEINLSEEDIEYLQTDKPAPLPNSFSAMCRIAAESEEAIERGEFQVWVESASGPTGATLLGRFCHADAELRQEVERGLRAEEAFHPEAVFAELAHLPEGRIGNILARPVLREYEIPYLGQSGAARDRQLPVTDLLVSVLGERIVLRSARLGSQVIPRLTSAHNYARESSTVYRFLCDLQSQGAAISVAWRWGALESAPFLPRVTAGRVILSLAQWTIPKEELQRICEAHDAERFLAVRRWRVERRLPRFVALADGDNTLPVDFENALSVDSFAHIVKGRSQVKLRELWPAPERLVARDAEGSNRYVHELIVPFLRQSEKSRRPAEAAIPRFNRAAVSTAAAQRSFAPGSEWLYAKIYCGATTADQVLREAIAPAASEAIASGAADQWFFIRYSDPAWHLRVRFHGQPGRLLQEVWPALRSAMAPILEDGRVWRAQLDTYEREVERYGGAEGLALSEMVFQADSETAAEIVSLLDKNDAGLDERWRLALCGMDRLLNDMRFDTEAKLEILKSARSAFLAEFKADETLLAQLSERYRNERKRLDPLLDPARDKQSALAPALAAFERRSMKLRAVAEELRRAEREGRLSLPLAKIAESYLHMSANRTLRSAHRAQEVALYDLLTRLYSAQLARKRPDTRQISDQRSGSKFLGAPVAP